MVCPRHRGDLLTSSPGLVPRQEPQARYDLVDIELVGALLLGHPRIQLVHDLGPAALVRQLGQPGVEPVQVVHVGLVRKPLQIGVLQELKIRRKKMILLLLSSNF